MGGVRLPLPKCYIITTLISCLSLATVTLNPPPLAPSGPLFLLLFLHPFPLNFPCCPALLCLSLFLCLSFFLSLSFSLLTAWCIYFLSIFLFLMLLSCVFTFLPTTVLRYPPSVFLCFLLSYLPSYLPSLLPSFLLIISYSVISFPLKRVSDDPKISPFSFFLCFCFSNHFLFPPLIIFLLFFVVFSNLSF